MSVNVSNTSGSIVLDRLKFSHLIWSSPNGGGDFLPRKTSDGWDPIIVIPLIATAILAVTVFLLVVFRQNPSFVISTVAGCLIFITIYLVLCAMESSRQYLA